MHLRGTTSIVPGDDAWRWRERDAAILPLVVVVAALRVLRHLHDRRRQRVEEEGREDEAHRFGREIVRRALGHGCFSSHGVALVLRPRPF